MAHDTVQEMAEFVGVQQVQLIDRSDEIRGIALQTGLTLLSQSTLYNSLAPSILSRAVTFGRCRQKGEIQVFCSTTGAKQNPNS